MANGPPLALTFFAVPALAALAVAGFGSFLRPFGIILESWRQTVDLLRYRYRLALYAFGFFAVQRLAAPLISFFPGTRLWVAVALAVLVKALVVSALAHVAYRLHRGLILGEWDRGLSFGAGERRMALYVLLTWVVVTMVGNSPIPAPPSVPHFFVLPLAVTVWTADLVLKGLLALTGPAASLDDATPLWRSVRSAFQEPSGIFSLVVMVRLIMEIFSQAIWVLSRVFPDRPIFAGTIICLSVVGETVIFLLAEFALVIALTRTWEDLYEPDTRRAAHNLDWL